MYSDQIGADGGQPHKPTNSGSYPRPEADYQELVQNPDGFLQKLRSFHASFGTKFKMPIVGGNPLDLHRLFIEVTSRGGIEKVVRDRRWKEITGSFRFPSSITSASFVLRKYYFSLLYHFEQVYYFRKEAPSVSVADVANRPVNGAASQQPFQDNANAEIIRLEAGNSVTGTIDAKFDYGYIVTVTLSNETFQGVLYHSPTTVQTSQRSILLSGLSSRDRRRHRVGRKDPSRPKRNRSGYNFFFSENYIKLKPSYIGQERALTRKIGIMWNRLSETEKKVYQEKGKRDKERHKREMMEYNASIVAEEP